MPMRIVLGAVGTIALMVGAVALTAGTAHAAQQALSVVGQPDAQRVVQFDVFLPLRNEAALDRLLEEQQRAGSPQFHRWLTPAAFKAQFGADAATVARVRAALEASGLSVEEHSSSLRVSGRADAVERALGTKLGLVATSAGRSHIAATDTIKLPAALSAAGAQIVAFNGYRQPKHIDAHRAAIQPSNRESGAGPYWFDDLKQAYDYPADNATLKGQPLDGKGSAIGIVISSDVLNSDLKAYFDHEKYAKTSGKPNPTVFKRRLVEGGNPFNANSDDSFEASLDVQQSLGSAPGAHLTLYNIPDLGDDSVIAGYVDVVEDNAVDVASSSFGGCELDYSPEWNGGTSYWGVLNIYDSVFKQGNAQGITWLASSGDSAGLGCPSVNYITGAPGPATFVRGVETPAASPYVTAVGGTNLVTTAPTKTGLKSAYVGENAEGDPEVPYDVYGLGETVSGGYWGAGGGLSVHYKRPAFQSLVSTRSTMRAVPDIGMQVGGCPLGLAVTPCATARSAVFEYLGGSLTAAIGTSVASPEFAGVVALMVQRNGGRLGNLNTYIYSLAAVQNSLGGVTSPVAYYHRKIPGFDGLYYTDYRQHTYNYITGNGTPDVRQWLNVPQLPAAGDPQTKSNP